MNTRRAVPALITALTAGILGVAAASAASPTPAPPETASRQLKVETLELAIPWQGGHMRVVDLGRKGDGPGDMFLVTGQPILDNKTRDRIGSADAVELIVSARHDGTVTDQTTLRFHGGHVDIDGVIRHTDHPLHMTVVGGTGRYLGVTGQLTLIKEDARRKVSVMRLELVR